MILQNPIETTEQSPPADEYAERGVIGSMMVADAAEFAEIRLKIRADRFFDSSHGVLFNVLCEMEDAGKPRGESHVVYSELKRRGILEDLGGIGALAGLLESIPSAHGAMYYADRVRETALRRDLIRLGNQMIRRGYTASTARDGDEQAQLAMEELSRITTDGRETEYLSIEEGIVAVNAQLAAGGMPLVPTGFNNLDFEYGGIGLGEMIIVAARPSMGKSTLIRQMAVSIARSGVATGIISLEEGTLKMIRNMLSSESGIDNNKIRRGRLSEEESGQIDIAGTQLSPLPIYFTERHRRIGDIRAIATVWAKRHGVQVLFIDYLQRVRGGSGKENYERVSNISLELSDLIKDLKLAGVVVAQLNRGPEGRDDKRPVMSDIRESGQIEQDADGIIFLHRDDYYGVTDPNYQPSGIAELIVAKWRDGKRGITIKLKSNLRFQRFDSIAPDAPDYSNNPFD